MFAVRKLFAITATLTRLTSPSIQIAPAAARHRASMRALRMVVAVGTSLALLTAPASAAPGGTASGDFVIGGGLRIAPDGVPNRTFSVNARSLPGGDASGYYTQLGLGATFRVAGAVTCIDVVGNHAVIGGTIASGIEVGEDFLVFFVDNGDPVDGQIGPDIVSLTYVGDDFGDLLVLGADFPVNFPASCPDANGETHANADFRDVQGNIVVNDGT